MKLRLESLALTFFFVMFIYSGFTKIFQFAKKVSVLQTKTKLPLLINQLGMIGVIVLEIVGSLLLLLDEYMPGLIHPKIIQLIYLVYMLFMIVVTLLYHPPGKAMIPFLSNMTTFGGFMYIYSQKF